MSKEINICRHCGEEFNPNPRVKEQKYCGKDECQKARHVNYQRVRMVEDPDYRDNQRRCQKEWHKNHPGYYKKWRAAHPDYVEKNRELQRIRNTRRSKNRTDKMIAKMYSLGKAFYSRQGSLFKLIPQDRRLIAKMNSFRIKLIPIQGVKKEYMRV